MPSKNIYFLLDLSHDVSLHHFLNGIYSQSLSHTQLSLIYLELQVYLQAVVPET